MKTYSASATLTQEEISYVEQYLRSNDGCVQHASGIIEVTITAIEGESHRLTLNGDQLIAETSAVKVSNTKCSDRTWIPFVKRLRWNKIFSSDSFLWLPLAGLIN